MRPARLVLCQPDGMPFEELTPTGPPNSRQAEWGPTALTALNDHGVAKLNDALRAVVLCSSASLDLAPAAEDPDALSGMGSPTEIALLELAHKAL
jgi:hypothetical protein